MKFGDNLHSGLGDVWYVTLPGRLLPGLFKLYPGDKMAPPSGYCGRTVPT